MEHVNPLKRIRLNQHYSLDRLASVGNLSRQLIINNENGQYEDPSPGVLSALSIIAGDDNDWLDTIVSDYHRWQKQTRRHNYGVLIDPLPINYSTRHPVVHWAEASNIPYTRISKLYCVHQGLMNRLKNQTHLVKSLPEQFVRALLDSGYSADLTSELEARFQKYKELELARIRIINQRNNVTTGHGSLERHHVGHAAGEKAQRGSAY